MDRRSCKVGDVPYEPNDNRVLTGGGRKQVCENM